MIRRASGQALLSELRVSFGGVKGAIISDISECFSSDTDYDYGAVLNSGSR